MTTTSGTIDGISYSSSQNVHDSRGYGIVTQILYFDQTGTQVADRYLFTDPNAPIGYSYGPKTVNSDGTFSFEITPTGGSGIPQGYAQNTFTSDGIVTRVDSFTPVYITGPDGGMIKFDVDPFRRQCLLNGWDDIGLTLRQEKKISSYEDARKLSAPWI